MHKFDPISGKVEKGVLILDELDTASEAEVKEITKALTANLEKIKRPVICICTNPYMPSFKDLKDKAFWLHLYENSKEKMVEFLSGVCKK